MTRDQWSNEFRALAGEYGYGELDPSDPFWDEYYEDGYTPEEAICDDIGFRSHE